MREKRILVLLPTTDEEKRRILDLASGNTVRFDDRNTVTKEAVHWADIIIGNPSSDLVRGAERLEYLQLSSAGCENYVKEGVLNDGVLLANATGTYGPGIGEYMTAVTLSHFRRLHLYRDQQRAHRWNNLGRSQSAEDAVILVLGAGDIGSHYAKCMKALGSYTIGVRRSSSQNSFPDRFDEMHTLGDLDTLLPKATVVAMALPNTPLTTGLMDRSRLSRMAPGSLLINVGRGSAIVTEDLMDALKNGPLGGAALDVTDPEPLPADHPLWDFDNITITPHNTGGSTAQTKERLFSTCFHNLKRYLSGKPVEAVDRVTGYKVSR